jgi:sulfur carrier protein ThiS
MDAILQEAGYSDKDIAALVEGNIVRQPKT